MVTTLFLRPIHKVLGEVGVAVQESAGYKSMQKTKWMTLTGSTLAVLSSSALYINVGLFMFLGKNGNPFYAGPYLNYAVFGMNLDSVLNDVGMMLVCGVLKTVSLPTRLLMTGRSIIVEPAPPPQPAFDSMAYETESSQGRNSTRVVAVCL